MFDEKAQLHTLEGMAAAGIMILVIVYAIDATSLTPLTSSTANVHVESELQMIGQDILEILDYSEIGYKSKLKTDISEWDGIKIYLWNGTDYIEKTNKSNKLKNNITNFFSTTFTNKGIAHNLEITFITQNGTSFGSVMFIDTGDPSDNAVIVSRKLILHNNEINQTAYINSPITDIDTNSNLYNILDIKLTMWRM